MRKTLVGFAVLALLGLAFTASAQAPKIVGDEKAGPGRAKVEDAATATDLTKARVNQILAARHQTRMAAYNQQLDNDIAEMEASIAAAKREKEELNKWLAKEMNTLQ